MVKAASGAKARQLHHSHSSALGYGRPLAFKGQDGIAANDVPPDADVVFVGDPHRSGRQRTDRTGCLRSGPNFKIDWPARRHGPKLAVSSEVRLPRYLVEAGPGGAALMAVPPCVRLRDPDRVDNSAQFIL